MAALNLTILQQLMANGDLNMCDLANISSINSQQQPNDDESISVIPSSGDKTGLQETNYIASTSIAVNNSNQSSTEFDRELLIEEVRKYRCLWDISSEVYKSKPMKQNAWYKLGQLFNKDGECQFISVIMKQTLCWPLN